MSESKNCKSEKLTVQLKINPLLPMVRGGAFLTRAWVACLRPLLLRLRNLLELLPEFIFASHETIRLVTDKHVQSRCSALCL